VEEGSRGARPKYRDATYFVNASCLAVILGESRGSGFDLGFVGYAIFRPLPMQTCVFLETLFQIADQGLEQAIFLCGE
jgi:hypothetical protein